MFCSHQSTCSRATLHCSWSSLPRLCSSSRSGSNSTSSCSITRVPQFGHHDPEIAICPARRRGIPHSHVEDWPFPRHPRGNPHHHGEETEGLAKVDRVPNAQLADHRPQRLRHDREQRALPEDFHQHGSKNQASRIRSAGNSRLPSDHDPEWSNSANCRSANSAPYLLPCCECRTTRRRISWLSDHTKRLRLITCGRTTPSDLTACRTQRRRRRNTAIHWQQQQSTQPGNK